MSYLSSYKLTNDGPFRQRLQFALWVASTAILANGAASADAKKFAKKNLSGEADADLMRTLSIRIASAPAVVADGDKITDDALQVLVNAAVTDLAG